MVNRYWRLVAATALIGVAGCIGPEEVQLPQLLPVRRLAIKTHFAKTTDNWRLALHRYANPEALKRYPPVILCHGFSYNACFWDLDEEHNLAEYLRKRGLDVWLLDLRGGGRSTRPGWSMLHGPMLEGSALTQYRFDKINWTVDDHILKDLPAAIDLVKRETGHPHVMWVGHSMGGMVAYGYLGRTDRQDIGRLVTVGSPMTIDDPPNRVLRDMPKVRQIFGSINSRFPSLMAAATGSVVKTPVDLLFYNDRNMSQAVVVKLYRKVGEDMSPGALKQFCLMLEKKEFLSADGRFSYAQALPKVKAPTLVIGGMSDNLASVQSICYAYKHIGSERKAFRVFRRINGDSADYGHDDLIVGKNARTEVFPVIADWLLRGQLTTQPTTRPSTGQGGAPGVKEPGRAIGQGNGA